MVEKLKSISRQTHWSLVVRAIIFALAWFFTPFWLFAMIAASLYFFPLFRPGKLFWPFVALLILGFLQPMSFLAFCLMGAAFYYLLLIKDLLLIDRKSAYELLLLGISFFLLRDFYQTLGNDFNGWVIWYSLLLAGLMGVLIHSFIRCFSEATEQKKLAGVVGWLSFMFFWQFLILGLFLPIDFTYQSTIVFLAGALAMDLVPSYYFGELSRSKMLATSTMMFALLVIVVAAARWTL
jgi:hypothetical protein